MAKKADLLAQVKELGLEATEKNTIAEIEAIIATAGAVDAEAEVATEEKKTAKAGKRSEKSLREAEEIAEKEARKEAGDTSAQTEEGEARLKGPKPTVRSRLERRGKSYRNVAKLLETGKVYSVTEAFELASKTNPAKFDASVEVHVRLGVDPRQADQNIRTTVSLPNGTGKTVRVAVFAPEAEHAGAKKAGADVIGDEEFLKQLEKEELNFDILIATPQYMPKLGKYARLLGPRGLMPNPKSGTVSTVHKKVRRRPSLQSIYIHHILWGAACLGLIAILLGMWYQIQILNQKNNSLQGKITSITIPDPSCTARNAWQQDTTQTFETLTEDGNRSYSIHLPKNFKADTYYPLIVHFPGKGASVTGGAQQAGLNVLNAIIGSPHPTIAKDGYNSWEGAPYSSGVDDYGGSTIRKLPNIASWSAARAQDNGCDPQSTTTNIDAVTTITSWNNCRNNATVQNIKLRGGGHLWWPEATQTLWQFMSRHSL
ncbi:hypothetical protein HY312_01875 [Candidatus Saccharibacteria bacterium]|nr:hypothetical protein [Candidatus Saccharibacteria bacterium]